MVWPVDPLFTVTPELVDINADRPPLGSGLNSGPAASHKTALTFPAISAVPRAPHRTVVGALRLVYV